MLACRISGDSPRNATAEWIAGLPDTIRRRLERVDLIAPQERRECPTVAQWVSWYTESRTDVKEATRTNYKKAEKNLHEFFAQSKRLDEVTAGDAEEFRIHLKAKKKYAEATIRRRCKWVKQFFAAAVKKKIIAESPFADLKCGNFVNEKRFYFISREEAEVVLSACPSTEWKLIFALCRFGGLRCPTEVLGLTWADIDWDKMRFTVRASKTEHHEDGGIRQVPIFPELHPYLRDCFEQAEDGAVHVITQYRNAKQNLRTQLGRIIDRAGLKQWPKLFQNLRSTRETELREEFPMHVVCKWIGNSEAVASKYYLQVTEDHFNRAAHNSVQYPAELASNELQEEVGESEESSYCEPIQNDTTPCKSKGLYQLTPRGLEPRLPG